MRPCSYGSRQVRATLIVMLLSLAACGRDQQPSEAVSPRESASPSEQVSRLEDKLWQHMLDTTVAAPQSQGLALEHIPDIDYATAAADAEWATARLAELAAIDHSALRMDEQTSLLILAWDLEARANDLKFFWLDSPVTPYNGGWALVTVHQALAAHPLATAVERDRYLSLLGEYADLVRQIQSRLAGQMERGIYLARPALPGARGVVSAYRNGAAVTVAEDSPRLDDVAENEKSAFLQTQAALVSDEVVPAFDAVLTLLGENYETNAPDGVGLSQYAEGRTYYEYLVRQFTRERYTPELVFEYGQSRMSEIQAEMASIRESVGFDGSQSAFHEMLRTDPRFVAETPQHVESRYRQYIERIEPLIDDYFSLMPEAPYGVRRLDPEAEPGMTFGFYDRPTPDKPIGEYRYNGSNLKSRSLIGAGGLIYHELIPGHHFHIALQTENDALPKFRRYGGSLALSAFNEGWAEYAASLAGEMGLLEDPYDRYGRLVMDAFLTSRLVVDPGMNYFGWTPDQARDYMARNTMQSDVEIASEALRYSSDIYGQAVAYKIGHREILRMRRQAEAALGDRFDIREFHALVVGEGAMPLDVLQQRVDWYIEEAGHSGQ